MRKMFYLKIVLLVLVLAVMVNVCQASTFTLKKEAVVKTDKIYFKDVTNVYDGKIGEVEIGKSAFPKKHRNISRYYILSKLKQAGYNVLLEGEESVLVLTDYSKITPEQLYSLINEYFENNHKGVEVEYIQPLKEVIVPCGKISLQINKVHHRSMVWVNILVDEKMYKTLRVPVRIKENKIVFFPKRSIARREELKENDFEKKVISSSFLPFDVVSDVSYFENTVAKQNIAPSTPLRKIHLAERLPCRKNDIVLIVGNVGVLEVKTQGKALQDGRVGDVIKVLTTSKREILAKVMGEKMVKVNFQED